MKKEEVEKIEKGLKIAQRLARLARLLKFVSTSKPILGSDFEKELQVEGYIHKSQITIDEGKIMKEIDTWIANLIDKKGYLEDVDNKDMKRLAQALKKANPIKIEEVEK